jgi:hypothetical protein
VTGTYDIAMVSNESTPPRVYISIAKAKRAAEMEQKRLLKWLDPFDTLV